MEYSWRYRADLRDIFTNTRYYRESSMLSTFVTHNQNNVYKHSLVVDVTKDEVEFPVIARQLFENVLIRRFSRNLNCKVERVILPLYVNNGTQERRTSDSIIHQFFTTQFSERITKITTSKGEVYYGGKGLILDSNFNPLLMCSLVGNIEGENKDRLVYKKALIRVSPQVFTDATKMIHKSIIKKMIPFYVSEGIDFHMSTTTQAITANLTNSKPQVVIEDFSRFFISPVRPFASQCSQEALNKVLIDNIEDILDNMV